MHPYRTPAAREVTPRDRAMSWLMVFVWSASSIYTVVGVVRHAIIHPLFGLGFMLAIGIPWIALHAHILAKGASHSGESL